ncbi:MAG: hypothetical protein R3204_01430 [Oceanospirillum sp.]|nr:hypothetical protein [Oceanospirillum sp.]
MSEPFILVFRKGFSVAGPQGESGELAAFSGPSHRLALFWLSEHTDQSLMLGYFANEESLEERATRFIEKPLTTPTLALREADAQQLREQDSPATLPPFEGIFGTAFSGYLVKPDSVDESDQLMLFYTADYRSELLGVFDAVETLQVLTAHYDRRRSQCLLC